MSEYDGLLPEEAVAAEIEEHGEPEAEEEIPPEPDEVTPLHDMPLAQREAFKLAQMTPEQRARYDAANAEIFSHPAVAAFAQEEDRRIAAKADVQAAFLKAWHSKKKESK